MHLSNNSVCFFCGFGNTLGGTGRELVDKKLEILVCLL